MKMEMEKWRDAYLNEVGTTYKNHVNKFIKYLKHINKADMPNKVTLDDVRNCIGYYVEEGSLGAIRTMESHLESLKSFYDYLLKKGKSADIFSQMNYEEYKNSITKEFELAEKVSRAIFTVETMKDILAKLDDYLTIDYYSLTGTNSKKRYIYWSALRLFIKLTLIAPTKRQVICNLTCSDFGKDLRTVTVNDIILSIPNSLRNNIIDALKLKNENDKKNIKEKDKIFKYIVGSSFKDTVLNTWFCSFIKEQSILGIDEVGEKTTYPVEPIMKTAISNLLKNGANLAYVSKVSGIDIASLKNTYIEDIFNYNRPQPAIGESIDWEIGKSGYYSYI